ncbi:O-antigen ligase family protein [Krasilnikovia sp. MM14-A1259]|uniref:O-antigen ligase family protein n=1 Tax=Krasilnikovia sp. MM14-A1259 TaxID=3373539 RepID=UPI003825A4B0
MADDGNLGLLRSERLRPWWVSRTRGARIALLWGGAALLAGAEVVSLAAGLHPALPFVVAFLLFVALRPFPGAVFAATVFFAPLGLWLLGVQRLVGDAFGGHDYVLSLSASVVCCTLLLVTLIRRRPTQRQLTVAVVAAAIFAIWIPIGVAHHGVSQTLVGVRLMVLPVVMLVVVLGLSVRELHLLISVTAWLVIANAVAAVAEYIIGPTRLLAYGFEPDRAIRYIGSTFRAPGLTEVNAALGLLCGAYLLGYAALWLVRDLRPNRLLWHVAGGAAAVGLVLSTSRTGALLLVGGMVVAIVLNRGGGPAARKRARWIGVAVVAVVLGGFAALGVTGSTSTFERFTIWGRLLRSGAPWYGNGMGSVGAATNSRASSSAQVFVDNYFVSVSLQLGIPVLVTVLALVCWGLYRLSRGSSRHPEYAVHLAVLAGLASGCVMIEVWEYATAMLCLVTFVAFAVRAGSLSGPPETGPDGDEPGSEVLAETVRLQPGAAAETVRLQLDLSGETVVMNRPGIDDTVILNKPGPFPDRDTRKHPERYRR